MPRPISNQGLRELIRERFRRCSSLGSSFDLIDLACYLGVHERSIYAYAAGRRKMPQLEKRLAKYFGISVNKLRDKLNLNNPSEVTHVGRRRGKNIRVRKS